MNESYHPSESFTLWVAKALRFVLRTPCPIARPEDEVGQFGINSAQLRKARSFANPKTGYDSTALDALCRDIRTYFDNFTRPKSVFGIAHVLRLLSIPTAGGKRKKVQRRVFQEGWTTAKLGTEVRRLYGRRRKGGRRKRVGDTNELLDRLELFCETWRRWYAQISTAPVVGDEAPVGTLPNKVRKLVPPVEKAIAELHKAVTATLLPIASKE